MAKLKEPGLGLKEVSSEIEASNRNVDPGGDLSGALFSIEVGTYECFYRVVQMEPFTIQHVCGYSLPPPYVRGLIPDDIRDGIRQDLELRRYQDERAEYHEWETALRKLHGAE